MDYEINIETLTSKQTELETLKTTAEDIYNEFNSCYLSGLNNELSSLKTTLKNPIERSKKGLTNSNNWYKKYLKELQELEERLANYNSKEFTGKFEDLFGKKTMPILKTGADIKKESSGLIENANITSKENLRAINFNGETFYIADTKIPLEEYEKYIRSRKMYQDAGFQGSQCMILSQYYASDMISGKFTTKEAMDNHRGAPAVKMNERCKSTDPDDVLRYVYQEINAGNPVVLQVTQKNSNKGARHLVTMVGYTSDVKSYKDLTPDKILVLDCYDGKVQTLSTRNRRLFNQGGNYQALGPTEKFLATVA